jgi:hypothetical protein
MHRARMIPQPVSGDYNWYHPLIRFASVPRSSLHISGNFEYEMNQILELIAMRSGKTISLPTDRVIMPIHELQIPTIISKFEGVEVLNEDIGLPAQGQISLR